MSFLTTEYRKNNKTAQVLAQDVGMAKDHEHKEKEDEVFDEPLVITFTESSDLDDLDLEFHELDLDDLDVIEFSDSEFDLDIDELMDSSNSEAMPFKLPGAVDYVEDDFEEKEEEKEEVPTDWENDRDVKHFMSYILRQYPGGIPQHDGKSTLGCEKAILFLTNLNKEISEALRSDNGDHLDLSTLENMRVNMVKDVMKLKEHIKKLNKKLKKADMVVPTDLIGVSETLNKVADIKKEASTPKIQLVMTPFQRAITGIIINSVVSAGKPLEDVYEFLKKKYKFTDREELEILQLLLDMGQPIFKDRGILGESDGDEKGHGLDFIKNYFA